MLLMLAAVFIYFLPSFIARHRQSFAAIFLFNFFLGWTFIGWIVALFWAVLAEPRVPVIVASMPAYAYAGHSSARGAKFCSGCGRLAQPDGRFCAACGRSI
jgi:Superinfection immunity protein